jgi:AhpD family alkylhydroperoxidase
MQARIKNPAAVVPGAMQAIQALIGAVQKAGTPDKVLHLAHLRASQINGCAACVDGGVKHAKQAGETDERLYTVSAWREAPYFSDAERAALALTEAVTLVASTHVPQADVDDAAEVFTPDELTHLLYAIIEINAWNRLAITTGIEPGTYEPPTR